MNLPLLALLVFCQDPTVDDVCSKIEARTAPIGSLTADLSLKGLQVDEGGVRIAGRVEFARGGHFRRSFHLWAGNEGLLIVDDHFAPNTAAFKALFCANREGAFYLSTKFDPAKSASVDRGMLDMILLMFGLETNLIDVSLWPRSVLACGKEPRAGRRKEKDRDYVTLTVSRTLSGFGPELQAVRLTWLFDAATYRVEKLEMENFGQVVLVECSRYEKVNGVELPAQIRMNQRMGFGEGVSEIAISNFRTEKTAPASWVDDPLLPTATDASTDDLKAQLAKDPTNPTLALAYANAVWPQVMMERKGTPDEIVAALEKAAPNGADSAAFQTALYCAYLGKKDLDGCDRVAKHLAEKKMVCPEVASLRAMQLLIDGKHGELLATVDQLGTESLYADLAAVLRLAAQAAQAADGAELAKTIQAACEGRDVARRIELLFAVEPPPSKRGRGASGVLAGKSPEFQQKLLDSGTPEATLLVARAHARNGKPKEAAELYAKLADRADWIAALEVEIQAFCATAKAEAAPILEKMFDRLTDVELLLSVAEANLDKKDEAKFERAIRRALELLPKHRKSYRDPDAVTPLLKKMLDGGQKDLAKQLLVAYADRMNASSFLYAEENIVSRVLSDDNEAKYDFLRAAGVSSYAMERVGLNAAQTFEILKKRIDGDARAEADAEALASFVTDASLRQDSKLEEITAYLEKAAGHWPTRADTRERLADAHALAGQWAKAAPGYRESLKLEKDRPKSSAMDYAVSVRPPKRIDDPDEDPQPRFDVFLPTIVKLTHALVQTQQKDAAVQAVEQFLKDFPQADRMAQAAQAYEVLDLPEPLLALKKKIFLARHKEVTPKQPWQAGAAAEAAMDYTRLCLRLKKFEEAYVASEMAVELAKTTPGGDSVKAAEALRAEALKSFPDEEAIRAFAGGAFEAVTDETKKQVEELLGELEADEPFARQEAEEKLREFGPKIAPLLIAAMKDRTGETLTRLQALVLGHARRWLREKFLK